MSKFVRVKTELRDVTLVKRVLEELEICYDEDVEFEHLWTRTRTPVRILIETPSVNFGLRDDAEGVLELLGNDLRMGAIRNILDRVQQRYAYHNVLRQVNEAGFALVDERTGDDNVIRLTVRRWS